MQLTIPYKDNEVFVADESPYRPQSVAPPTTNLQLPVEEYFIEDDGYPPSSRHRVTLRRGGVPFGSRVLMARDGATGVHARSAFVHGDTCFIAVGPFVCALELPTLRLLWHSRADAATCFGIYDAPAYASIISHGELEIARLNYSGQLVWSAGGRDIFTEGFELHVHRAEAVDFDGARYQFALATGQSQIIAA